MIAEIRKKINSEFSIDKYNSFINELNSTHKYPTDFRTAETPIFLPRDLTQHLVRACDEIVEQLQTAQFIHHASTAIPKGLAVPNETPHTAFLQIDFGISRDNAGKLFPQLIELQGFPSLYGYQAFLNDTTRKYYSIPENFGASFNGFVRETYEKLLYDVIVENSDPKNVILLEIEPEKQKTRIDFAVTEKMLGIKTVCLTKIKKRKNKLYYVENGKEILIERIYNRVIFDELERKNIKTEFRFTDEIDVQWVGHPNWYFRISKHTLPFLKSKYVPECYFLNQLNEYPNDLQNYVLKPLYSFAGLGVDVEVTKAKLDSLNNKGNYLLQKKVEYSPVIETPEGNAKAEVRMMFIWKEKPQLVKNLVRLSKGAMMGVDFNKNKTWVGSTLAYHEPI